MRIRMRIVISLLPAILFLAGHSRHHARAAQPRSIGRGIRCRGARALRGRRIALGKRLDLDGGDARGRRGHEGKFASRNCGAIAGRARRASDRHRGRHAQIPVRETKPSCFWNGRRAGGFTVAGWVEGTFRISRDPRTGNETVTQDSSAFAVFDAATRTFRTEGIRRMPIGEFRARIAAAVARSKEKSR